MRGGWPQEEEKGSKQPTDYIVKVKIAFHTRAARGRPPEGNNIFSDFYVLNFGKATKELLRHSNTIQLTKLEHALNEQTTLKLESFAMYSRIQCTPRKLFKVI